MTEGWPRLKDDLQVVPQIYYLDRAIIFIPIQVPLSATFDDKALLSAGYFTPPMEFFMSTSGPCFRTTEKAGRI